MTHLFAVPLDAKSVLIAKDTRKTASVSNVSCRTIYIPGMN